MVCTVFLPQQNRNSSPCLIFVKIWHWWPWLPFFLCFLPSCFSCTCEVSLLAVIFLIETGRLFIFLLVICVSFVIIIPTPMRWSRVEDNGVTGGTVLRKDSCWSSGMDCFSWEWAFIKRGRLASPSFFLSVCKVNTTGLYSHHFVIHCETFTRPGSKSTLCCECLEHWP